MKKFLIFGIGVLFLSVAASSAHARGGGGCLEEGTPVLTPFGRTSVEHLKPGDEVLGVSRGAVVSVHVKAMTRVQPDDYCEINVDGHSLRVTAEHPIETAPGVFRMASFLKAGDAVLLSDDNGVRIGTIKSVARVPAVLPAYNLLVAPNGTYLAGVFVVHNKGCFLPETLIRRRDGTETPIDRIRPRDRLLAFSPDGHVKNATVRQVLTYDVDVFCIIRTENMVLHVTPEHPFYVGSGTFKTLEALKVGDVVFAFDGHGLSAQHIESIETVHARTRVYNLQTNAPNTFFANGVAVHNKGGGGGCFPAGTPILTAAGEVPIERIGAGDMVTSIDTDGRAVAVRVRETHVTRSPLLAINTGRGSLKTTAEHPVRLAAGGFRPAGELSLGEEILLWHDGMLLTTVVSGLQFINDEQTVYNMTVEWPHTFVANNFIVHNKGGGGFHSSSGYHSSRGGSGGGSAAAVVFVVIFGAIFTIIVIGAIKQAKNANLDFVYSPSQVVKKSEKTLKLIEFLSKQDPKIAPTILRERTTSTFQKLQQCWQSRNYAPMKPILMPDLYADHNLQIQGLIRNHEINVIEPLRIDGVDLVNVRYTIKEEQREFTALITATARDYYIDDRTQKWIRGDREPAQFQEFWTFQFLNKSWLLREIEQTRESDALKEDNFVEQLTDKGVGQIYDESSSEEGPAGPWLEKKVAIKETRVERMLNFLVQTDKIWDRKSMLLTARRVFLGTMAAWESGSPDVVSDGELFPDIAAHLREEITKNRKQGVALEFRNLCVRKVELILVRNFAENSKDEFIARVRAHAQKVMKQQGAIVQQDEDVTPFEQYLTFGRLDNRWKLKEVLLSIEAQGLITQENVDQDSNVRQLQWYYQHKRAM